MRKTCLLATALLLTTLLGGCSFKRWAYEGIGRDGWQQPERVIDTLGLAPGDSVADLGSGTGYFTARLARAVAPGGTVYAVDIDADVQEELRERVAAEGVDNVEIVIAEPDDSKLPDASVDLVLTVNTFHHFEDPTAYFRKLVRVLKKPTGRIAIIELNGEKGLFARWSGHYTTRDALLKGMAAAGFVLREEHDFLDRQSFVVFQPY